MSSIQIRLLDIRVMSDAMHTGHEQRIDGRRHAHRMVLHADRDASFDELVVRQHLRDDLRVGDSPVDVERVLDTKVVNALERRLIHDQISRDEQRALVTQLPQNGEDTLAALGRDQHVGVSAWRCQDSA